MAQPFERDYVVILSDWTFEDPWAVMKKRKAVSETEFAAALKQGLRRTPKKRKK